MCDNIRSCLFDDDSINNSQNNLHQETLSSQDEVKYGLNTDQCHKIKAFKADTDEMKEESKGLKNYQTGVLNRTEKSSFRNFERCTNLYRKEYEEQLRAKRTFQESGLRQKQLHQENVLAHELEMINIKEFTNAKMRQQLRENSSELRELERKLKAAYINKELAAQIAQKEAERINEKIRDSETYEIMRQAWVNHNDYQKQLLQEDMLKKAQYKQDLQEQLIMREKMKRHLYEEYLREKKLIDDIVQRIQDEDEREAYEKFCKTRKTKAEMIAFKNAQEVWKKKRMEEIDEENRRIEEYLMTKTTVLQTRQIEQARKEAEREKVIESIARAMCEQREKQREREEIIADLQQEEQKELLERRHREDIERQLRIRLETQQCLAQQMREREERCRQEAEEDRRYKEELLTKLAEEAKLEQLSAQKKRMKMLQLKRDVEDMMKERRQKHAEELQLLIEMEKDDQRQAEARRRVIEEERIRMLQEHVKNLIGYLPKGLLKVEDLPSLSTDVVNHVFKGGQSPDTTDFRRPKR